MYQLIKQSVHASLAPPLPVILYASSLNKESSIPNHLDFLLPEMQPGSAVMSTVYHTGLDSHALTSEQPTNTSHIRSSFLKRNTHVESIKLIQTSPLVDLQSWCASASFTTALRVKST